MGNAEPGRNVPIPVERSGPRADTGVVGTAVLLVVAIVLPTALGCAVLGAIRVHHRLAERRRRPPLEPIEHIGADLRRLHAQLADVENQPARPGKGLRVTALRAAYVDVLSVACLRLDVDAPRASGSDRVPLPEIYRVECDLRAHGLDVRERVTG